MYIQLWLWAVCTAFCNFQHHQCSAEQQQIKNVAIIKEAFWVERALAIDPDQLVHAREYTYC